MEQKNEMITGEDYERLAFAFDRVANSLDELTVEFGRSKRRARWLAAAGGTALTLLTFLTGVSYIVTHSNSEVIERIDSCTTPGQECYQRNVEESNKRTGPFIQLICNATPPERRQPPC